MALETASYISQLAAANPLSSDSIAQGDDHIRLLKAVLQSQFPNLGAVAVVPTGVELNYVGGVTSSIQAQINSLDSLKAPKASPTFTGTITGVDADLTGTLDVTGIASFASYVTGVTETPGSNNTRFATTAFVQTAVTGATGGVTSGKTYFLGSL